jgi:AP-3 complex subunit delta-1
MLTITVKYVALLAFEKIVVSHPYLVSNHQDVILECIDNLDISIRMLALNLVVGMVNSDNITDIVNRLLQQLVYRIPGPADLPDEEKRYDSNDESDEERQTALQHQDDLPQIPDEYRSKIIRNILDMCAKDTYSNLNDFEWYIKVLVELVKSCPMVQSTDSARGPERSQDISYTIGAELLNIAVRVKAMRPEATAAAETLVIVDNRDRLFPSFSNGGLGVLEACGWIVGEYAQHLSNPRWVLDSLIHSSTSVLPVNILAVYIQAALKVFARIIADQDTSWTPQRHTESTLLMSRLIHFLEPLTTQHDLEVQELAVEYLELMRLASEAASSQPVSQDGEYAEPPLLLTQAIPSLFSGFELNPVAPGAQSKIEVPEDLDLSTPINPNLNNILQEAEKDELEIEHDPFTDIYNRRPAAGVSSYSEPLYDSTLSAAERLDAAAKSDSYQTPEDPETRAERLAAQRERNKDDPFYIGPSAAEEDENSKMMHNIIRSTNNGETLDLDAIPVLPLDLDGNPSSPTRTRQDEHNEELARRAKVSKARKQIQIAADETIGEGDGQPRETSRSRKGLFGAHLKGKKSNNLLGIDSSGLKSLSLEGSSAVSPMLDVEQREEEERALREVEKLRLEMERAAERIQAREEAVVVKRKKKKKKERATEDVGGDAEGEDGKEKKRKKKKKKEKKEGEVQAAEAQESTAPAVDPQPEVKKKKKKRREVDMTGGQESAGLLQSED